MAALQVARRDGLLTLTLNRPESGNALSNALIVELSEALHAARDDRTTHAVVLTGAGEIFCAGLDLHELATAAARDPSGCDVSAFAGLLRTIDESPKLTIAAVNGPARAGGVALLCVCDVSLAAPSATFGLPALRTGIVPPILVHYLFRRIGETHARHLLLADEDIDASRASAIGLVTRVSQPDHCLADATTLAGSVGAHGQEMLRALKATFPRGPVIVSGDLNRVAFGPNAPAQLERFLNEKRGSRSFSGIESAETPFAPGEDPA